MDVQANRRGPVRCSPLPDQRGAITRMASTWCGYSGHSSVGISQTVPRSVRSAGLEIIPPTNHRPTDPADLTDALASRRRDQGRSRNRLGRALPWLTDGAAARRAGDGRRHQRRRRRRHDRACSRPRDGPAARSRRAIVCDRVALLRAPRPGCGRTRHHVLGVAADDLRMLGGLIRAVEAVRRRHRYPWRRLQAGAVHHRAGEIRVRSRGWRRLPAHEDARARATLQHEAPSVHRRDPCALLGELATRRPPRPRSGGPGGAEAFVRPVEREGDPRRRRRDADLDRGADRGAGGSGRGGVPGPRDRGSDRRRPHLGRHLPRPGPRRRLERCGAHDPSSGRR